MLEQSRRNEEEARAAAREDRKTPARSDTASSSYWDYVTQQVQEHTQKLGLAGESVDRLEESSEGFAQDVDKMLKRQRNKAALGGEFSVGPVLLPLGYDY